MTQKKMEVQVKVSDEVLKGVYSNNLVVGHSVGEFVMDFMTMFHPQGILSARVITSPNTAKRMLSALAKNIELYEKKFGEIKVAEESFTPIKNTH